MPELQSSPPFDSPLSPALLIQAVQEVSSAATLPDIVRIVTRTARVGTGAAGVSFVLRDGDLCHYLEEDCITPLWKGKRFPINECVSGWAMLHRRPVAIADISVDLRVPQDAYQPTFVRSLVMVPIRSSAPLGALGAYWPDTREAPAELVTWLQALADASSAGIEAVRANSEVAELRRSGSNPPHGEAPREFVRMCAWTKRIFYQDQWMSIEAYLRSRYGVSVTHGMSEDALTRLKQEITALGAAGKPPPA